MDLSASVKTIMSSDLVTVDSTTPVKVLKTKFKRRGIHHILVDDEHDNLLGIISTEDLLRTAHFPVKEELLLAKHIMTVSPVKVHLDASIKSAIEIFLDNYFRAIPIVDAEEKLVGIITPYDVLAALDGRLAIENF